MRKYVFIAIFIFIPVFCFAQNNQIIYNVNFGFLSESPSDKKLGEERDPTFAYYVFLATLPDFELLFVLLRSVEIDKNNETKVISGSEIYFGTYTESIENTPTFLVDKVNSPDTLSELSNAFDIGYIKFNSKFLHDGKNILRGRMLVKPGEKGNVFIEYMRALGYAPIKL
jgi:hypothetical protein